MALINRKFVTGQKKLRILYNFCMKMAITQFCRLDVSKVCRLLSEKRYYRDLRSVYSEGVLLIKIDIFENKPFTAGSQAGNFG